MFTHVILTMDLLCKNMPASYITCKEREGLLLFTDGESEIPEGNLPKDRIWAGISVLKPIDSAKI